MDPLPHPNEEVPPARGAFVVFAATYLFTLIVQLGIYWTSLRPGEGAAFLAGLFLWQGQHLLVAALLGVGYLCTRRLRWLWVAYGPLLLAVLVVTACTPISFKVFGGPPRFDLGEANANLGIARQVAHLGGSIWAEVDGLVWLNLVLALALLSTLPLLTRRLAPGRVTWATAGLLVGASVIGGVAAQPGPSTYQLEQNPIISLVRSAFTDTGHPPEVPYDPALAGDLYRQRFGAGEAPLTSTLAEVRLRLRQGGRPNVVLWVLESAGAYQVLEGTGESVAPNRESVPQLLALSEHSVIFPQVYVQYPGTTRAQVALATGGHSITWGTGEELRRPYRGETMAAAMKRLGYQTGLVSAGELSFAHLNEFFSYHPWDAYHYYGDGHSFTEEQELSSWGVHEDAARQVAVEWLQGLDVDQRFFLQFHTAATHHPYVYPEGYQGPGGDRLHRNRHKRSLHFTDSVLGRFIEDLERLGQLERTIILVTGDHGQAFADRHPRNWIHGNHLYEENVRVFLVVAAPGRLQERTVSWRMGTIGDVLPTILGLVEGQPLDDIPGQDLFSAGYASPIVYFHKSSPPQKWGLRDGRWKYINRYDGSEAQLFDLVADPRERENRAATHPQQVEQYQRLAGTWFLDLNQRFLERLEEFDLGRARFDRADLVTPGPKDSHTGLYLNERYHGLDRVHPAQQDVRVWVRWMPYPEPQTVQVDTLAPDGTIRHQATEELDPEWALTWFGLGVEPPLEAGIWTQRYTLPDGEVYEHHLIVTADAEPVEVPDE